MTYERHSLVAQEALFPSVEGETKNTSLRRIEVENQEGKKLIGLIAGKSVVFPISTDESLKTFLNDIAKENISQIDPSAPNRVDGACRLLHLAHTDKVDGIYVDSDSFKTITGIHLHPNGSIITEEEFLSAVMRIFKEKGLVVAIEGLGPEN